MKSTPGCSLFVDKSDLQHNFLYTRFLLISLTADKLMTYPPLRTTSQFLLDTEMRKSKYKSSSHTIHLPNIKKMLSKHLWTQFLQSLLLPSLDEK